MKKLSATFEAGLKLEEQVTGLMSKFLARRIKAGAHPTRLAPVLQSLAAIMLCDIYKLADNHGMLGDSSIPEPSRRALFLKLTAGAFNAVVELRKGRVLDLNPLLGP